MKLAALFLLLLLSFNFTGYRLLFYFLQKKADTAMAARLDAQQYSKADLITLSIPLRLPYQTVQTDFERADGEIKLEGKTYRYVLRKVERGQLVLLCLPHVEKMQLQQATQAAAELAGEVPAQGKKEGATMKGLKNRFSDYDKDVMPWALMPFAIALKHHPTSPENLLFSFCTTPEQPPEAATA